MEASIYIKKEDFLPWNLGRRMYTYNYTLSNKNEKDEGNYVVVEFKRVMCHSHNEQGVYGVFPYYYISIRDDNYKDSIEIKNYHDARKILKNAIQYANENIENVELECEDEDDNSVGEDIVSWKIIK